MIRTKSAQLFFSDLIRGLLVGSLKKEIVFLVGGLRAVIRIFIRPNYFGKRQRLVHALHSTLLFVLKVLSYLSRI